MDKFPNNKESEEILDKYACLLPSQYKDNKDVNIDKTIADIDEVIKTEFKLNPGNTDFFYEEGVKQAKPKYKNPRPETMQRVKDFNTLSILKSRLELTKSGETLKTGTGVRKSKYKQPKRNAYKIQNNKYGKLHIDVSKLMNEMELDAYRNGKIVYQADADKSLINLLTKRYNPKTKYSINATKIFNDLNMLANMPKHKS